MRPAAIERRLKLRQPIYQETAAYGHMGREPQIVTKHFRSRYEGNKDVTVELFTWEKLDYVDKVKAAIRLAYEEGESKLKGTSKSVPAFEAIKNPLRDGDLERPGDPAYAGCYFINANAKDAPGIIDKNKQPIIDHSEIYSGVKGRVSITFFAFNNSGNRGIACHLNNLQKWEDGEPLGSKASAESDFSDVDDDFLF